MLREMVTDADVFGINFPMDLDVKMKAVLLSACFLIVSLRKTFPVLTNHFNNFRYFVSQDFMYFEDKQNSRNDY